MVGEQLRAYPDQGSPVNTVTKMVMRFRYERSLQTLTCECGTGVSGPRTMHSISIEDVGVKHSDVV